MSSVWVVVELPLSCVCLVCVCVCVCAHPKEPTDLARPRHARASSTALTRRSHSSCCIISSLDNRHCIVHRVSLCTTVALCRQMIPPRCELPRDRGWWWAGQGSLGQGQGRPTISRPGVPRSSHEYECSLCAVLVDGWGTGRLRFFPNRNGLSTSVVDKRP